MKIKLKKKQKQNERPPSHTPTGAPPTPWEKRPLPALGSSALSVRRLVGSPLPPLLLRGSLRGGMRWRVPARRAVNWGNSVRRPRGALAASPLCRRRRQPLTLRRGKNSLFLGGKHKLLAPGCCTASCSGPTECKAEWLPPWEGGCVGGAPNARSRRGRGTGSFGSVH